MVQGPSGETIGARMRRRAHGDRRRGDKGQLRLFPPQPTPINYTRPNSSRFSWLSPCKGFPFDIANEEESASEAWVRFIQQYHTRGLNKPRWLTIDFYTMKMELGKHPRK